MGEGAGVSSAYSHAMPNAFVVGAAGALGSAVLEQALAAFERVRVLVDEPVTAAMRGFDPVPLSALDAGVLLHADTGFVVFDRERHAHGREAAFHRPQPDALPRLAHALHVAGVAHATLAQLHWMVPQQEQPVRAQAVAAFVVELARQLPRARAGARVVPPELVWQAARGKDAREIVEQWLHG